MTKLVLATLLLLAALAPVQAQTICMNLGNGITTCIPASSSEPTVVCVDMGNGMTVCN